MIILITVPGTPPIVAKIKEEDDEYIHVEYPIIFMKDEAQVYTMPYMPFADNGKVWFSKNSIIATSRVHKLIEAQYKVVVKEFKTQKLSFVKTSEEESKPEIKIPDFKPKTFH